MTFSQSDLSAGTTYYYLVCANNAAGQTCANWVSVTTPGAPTAPSSIERNTPIVVVDPGQISLILV